MLRVSTLLCGHQTGAESLCYAGGAARNGGPPRPVVDWAVTKNPGRVNS